MCSKGCTAVLELLATPAPAIIIAAAPGRRARSRGLPGGAAQEKIDVREIFGLVRFYTDDYLPVVSFTKRDDLFAFGHRPHANYRRPFVGSRSESERSSGWSGSIPTITFQWYLSQSATISSPLGIVRTRTTAGRLSDPNFAMVDFP